MSAPVDVGTEVAALHFYLATAQRLDHDAVAGQRAAVRFLRRYRCECDLAWRLFSDYRPRTRILRRPRYRWSSMWALTEEEVLEREKRAH